MPKRKADQLNIDTKQLNTRSTAFNREEMMIESVFLILKHNLLKGIPSNDTRLVEYANKLEIEELRLFNNKMKEILNI